MARDGGTIARSFREREATDRSRFLEVERERLRLDELVLGEQRDVASEEHARAGERLKPRAHVRVRDVLVDVEGRRRGGQPGDVGAGADPDVWLEPTTGVVDVGREAKAVERIDGDRGDLDVGRLDLRPRIA